MTHYLKKSEEEEENNKSFALIHFLLNSEKYSDIKSNYKIDAGYIAYYYMDIYIDKINYLKNMKKTNIFILLYSTKAK